MRGSARATTSPGSAPTRPVTSRSSPCPAPTAARTASPSAPTASFGSPSRRDATGVRPTPRRSDDGAALAALTVALAGLLDAVAEVRAAQARGAPAAAARAAAEQLRSAGTPVERAMVGRGCLSARSARRHSPTRPVAVRTDRCAERGWISPARRPGRQTTSNAAWGLIPASVGSAAIASWRHWRRSLRLDATLAEGRNWNNNVAAAHRFRGDRVPCRSGGGAGTPCRRRRPSGATRHSLGNQRLGTHRS